MQSDDDTPDLLLLPSDFDWYLLIGDETALPAIAKGLKEIPATYRIAILLEVDNPACRINFNTHAHPYIEWYYRNNTHAAHGLMHGLAKLYIPPGEGFVWAEGGHGLIESAKNVLLNHHGIDVSLATQLQI